MNINSNTKSSKVGVNTNYDYVKCYSHSNSHSNSISSSQSDMNLEKYLNNVTDAHNIKLFIYNYKLDKIITGAPSDIQLNFLKIYPIFKQDDLFQGWINIYKKIIGSYTSPDS